MTTSRIGSMIMLVLFNQLFTSVQFVEPVEGEDVHLNVKVFVSRKRGIDRQSCGSELEPCKSICMGALRANNHAQVYVDGTETDTSPYSCQSSTMQIQGIYLNKSVSLIGVQSEVNIKCHDGLGISLNHSNLNHSEITITLTNISFIESPLIAQDVNIFIDSCNFVGALSAVTLTQSTISVTLSFTNSSCLHTRSCIIADASQIPQGGTQRRIFLNITDSKIAGTLTASPTFPNRAIGLHVFSSDDNSGSIICDISLKNVTFNDNFIGSKGVIYVELPHGFSSLLIEDVDFLNNKFVSRSPSNIIFIRSYNHDVFLNNAMFSIVTIGRAIKLSSRNSSKLQILNSNFSGVQYLESGSAGMLYITSEHTSEVYIFNTNFSNIRTNAVGSCMYLTSQTAKVQIENCEFVNNHGSCAGIFWLSVQELLVTFIQGCYFESIGALGPGGLASCFGKFINITMLDSKINGSHTSGPGGVFDIGFSGCGSRTNILTANLLFKNIIVEDSSSSQGSGGFAAVIADKGTIAVQDCVFSDIIAKGPGGVFLFSGTSNSSSIGLSLFVLNTIFKTSANVILGGRNSAAFLVSNVMRLFLDGVIIDSATTSQVPGAGLYIQGDNKMKINIHNSTFKNCEAQRREMGGILYLFTTKPLTMSISDSVFDSSVAFGPGGCMFLNIGESSVIFTNVKFKNCRSLRTEGGAVYIKQISLGSTKIKFKSCDFQNNTAQGGTGGALHMKLYKSKIVDPGCIESTLHPHEEPTPHRTWNYTSTAEFIRTVFTNNSADIGGALALSRGLIILKGCSFRNNFAKLRGGHIISYFDSTSLQIYHTTFLQTRKNLVLSDINKKFDATSFIDTDSEGPLILINSTLKSELIGDHVSPLVMVSQGGFVSFGEDNDTFLICPRGSELEILNITIRINTEYRKRQCTLVLSVLQFKCKSCQLGSYSLQYGRSAGLHKVGDFQCLPCPFGAECLHNIAAKSNFWGYKVQQNPPALNFTNCPVGYCKHPDRQIPLKYNSCKGNRSGVLCGHCKDDYTETLLSPSCRRRNECNDTWLWGVVILMILFMALFLVHKPHFYTFFTTQIFWFRKEKSNDEVSSFEHGMVMTHDNGYLKILFYFYQVANFLMISTSYDRVIEMHFLQPVVGFFNFQFRFSTNGFLCPFPGLTVVTKEMLFTCQVFGVFILIMFCYLSHNLFQKCRSRPPPNLGPYLGALLETMLLGYAVFAHTALKLLWCKSIGGESRLFIAGQVLCYQWWQYLLMVFVGVVVVPFILVIGLGSYWLDKGTISVKGFLLACALPLPYLVNKVAKFLFCAQSRSTEEPAEWKTSIKNVLFGPFRPSEEDSYGALYWESVLITRRLIIIIIHVSFSDPLSKQLLLTFVCVGILFHHSIVRPFRKGTANAAEMASLLALVAVAIINTPKASFLSTGQDPGGQLQLFVEILDWIQAVILGIVPVACSLVVIVSVVSQLVRLFTVIGFMCSWMCVKCCNRWLMKESIPLLKPTSYNASSEKQT